MWILAKLGYVTAHCVDRKWDFHDEVDFNEIKNSVLLHLDEKKYV